MRLAALALLLTACGGSKNEPADPSDTDTDTDTDTDADTDTDTDTDADTDTGMACPGFTDADGDGHGDPDLPTNDCLVSVPAGDDCNDGAAEVYPGAPERVLSDGDCDGTNDTSIVHADYVFVDGGPGDVAALYPVGDVDGDGMPDLVAQSFGPATRFHLLLGANLVPGVVDVSTASDAVLEMPRNEGSTTIVGADVDGDGLSDVVLGRPFDNRGTGEVRIFLGATLGAGGGAQYSLTDADHLLTAPAPDVGSDDWAWAGYSVDSLDDIDGDGLDDLLVGSPFYYSQPGMAHVVLGSQLGPAPLSLDDAAYTLRGEVAGDAAGRRVANGGDVDGDGLTDLLIGALGAPGLGGSIVSGRVYVVLGSSLTPDLSLADADHILVGNVDLSRWGKGLTSAGDVDGDGLDDLLIGGTWDYTFTSSFAKLIYAAELTAPVLTIDGSLGWTFPAVHTIEGEALGSGDLDGDGLSDVWVGAYDELTYGASPGSLSVVLGADAAAGPPATWSVLVDGASGVGLGLFSRSMPDFDGDGRDEIIVTNTEAAFLVLSKL